MGALQTYFYKSTVEEDIVPLLQASVSTDTPNQTNLEVFSLIWCDADVEKVYASRPIQENFLDLIHFQRTFKTVTECEKYISQRTTEKIILVSSGSFGEDLMNRVHHLPQVYAVYIYCLIKENYQDLLSNFVKVRCVENDATRLVEQIISDHSMDMSLDKQNISLAFFNHTSERTHKNLDKENGNFIWFQLFIETLLRMRKIDVDDSLKEFVIACNEQYADNARQLTKLKEFQDTYEPDHCLWWYSREVFLYGILNKALRTGDMDILYILRFFIRDLYQQLDENKSNIAEQSTELQLYRGQAIDCAEFDNIKLSIGQLASMNSFFSTTRKRPLALAMAQSNIGHSDRLIPVVFHIKVDPRLTHAKPYADISGFSNFGEAEAEVLFMLGSVFRLVDVRFCDDEQVHLVDLELCGENENELRELYSRMKNDIGEETDIKVLGNVLKDMGHFERALQCYEKVLKLATPNDTLIQRCYYSIGQVRQLQGHHEDSLFMFDKVLDAEAKNPSDDRIILGLTHNYMGIAYQYGTIRHDYTAALAHYQKALEIHLDVKGRLYPGTPYVYNNLATLYRALGDYEKSLEYHHAGLEIKKEQYRDPNDPRLATSIDNIGVVYQYKNDYEKALEYHIQALDIRVKALPADHQDQAASHANLSEVYGELKNYQLSFDHALEALRIYQLIFGDNHQRTLMMRKQIEHLQKISVQQQQNSDSSSN